MSKGKNTDNEERKKIFPGTTCFKLLGHLDAEDRREIFREIQTDNYAHNNNFTLTLAKYYGHTFREFMFYA